LALLDNSKWSIYPNWRCTNWLESNISTYYWISSIFRTVLIWLKNSLEASSVGRCSQRR